MIRKFGQPFLSLGPATPGRALPFPREGASPPPRLGRAPRIIDTAGGDR
jgi:hypothetical protein